MNEFIKTFGFSVAAALIVAFFLMLWVSPGTTEGMIFLFAVVFALTWFAIVGVALLVRLALRRSGQARFRSTRKRPDGDP